MTSAPISITLQPFDENTLKLSVPYGIPTTAANKQPPKQQWSKQKKCWPMPNKELLGHSSSKTTEIYTHAAAHKIIEIRNPIAGLLKTTEGSNDEL